MRKDVKTGMFAGTVLCLVAIVWFCAKQQIVTSPLIKFESPNLVELTEQEIIEDENADFPVSKMPEKPVVTEKSTATFNDSAYQPVQQLLTEEKKPAVPESLRVHTVTAGQTLSDISKIYYDSPNKWKKIYEANKEKFPKGPDAITPGMKLTIPQ
ncbi:MAG: LysM peptidoglycan-binding domain-containing protein [Sedimentisphaerales bacterium]|nr:LysM peptidoglycan-binding domain-containing protein [Sedimentisphaerales bacterium]